MKLICTERVSGQWSVVSGQWAGGRAQGRRGTAEIELLLVIPLLLTILFLGGGALSLGKARMANAYNAENDVYGQVVAGRGYSPTNNPAPTDGINAVKPALPNRYDLADEFKNVIINGQEMPSTIKLNDRAIMLDPAWHYSAWPQSGDRQWIQAWFEAYVAESHPGDVVGALGLQPPGPP